MKDILLKHLKKRSLVELFSYIESDLDLKEIQNKYPQYPKMKIIDMYFWQIGFNLEKKDEAL